MCLGKWTQATLGVLANRHSIMLQGAAMHLEVARIAMQQASHAQLSHS